MQHHTFTASFLLYCDPEPIMLTLRDLQIYIFSDFLGIHLCFVISHTF